MSVPFLDLHITDKDVRSEMDRTLLRLVDTISFVGGTEVEQFSKEFGEYCGGVHCIPVANGTDALFLALRALGIKPGDEVITVPFTFIATAEAITMVGAQIKFIDIHPKTYNLDPNLLERAITSKTKAILPVHLFGQPADMDAITNIALQHKIPVLEDAAQAHGAEYKGRRTGSLGEIACFSFYPTKNLGGFGDGGAVVSKSLDLIKKVTQLADHGRSDRYLHAIEGVNSRLDSFQAAVLRIKLKKLDQKNENRRHIAEKYNTALLNNSFITPPYIDPNTKHVFHLYCVETSFRDELMRFLKDRGIGCGVYYPIPLHLQPAYARLQLKRGDFPVSERLSDRILALPLFPEMTPVQIDEVCKALKEFTPNCRRD